jgi:hypothetical protein
MSVRIYLLKGFVVESNQNIIIGNANIVILVIQQATNDNRLLSLGSGQLILHCHLLMGTPLPNINANFIQQRIRQANSNTVLEWL